MRTANARKHAKPVSLSPHNNDFYRLGESSNANDRADGTDAACLLRSLVERVSSSAFAADKASASMWDRPLNEDGSIAIGLAIRLAAIIAIEIVQPDVSNEPRSPLRFAASVDTGETIQNGSSGTGSLLVNLQKYVRRHSRAVKLMADANKATDRGNDDRAIDDRPRKSIAEALSPREIATINLIGRGQSNKEIARTLGITPETVKSHVKHIFSKLEVDTRAQAVSRALALGLACEATPAYVSHGNSAEARGST